MWKKRNGETKEGKRAVGGATERSWLVRVVGLWGRIVWGEKEGGLGLGGAEDAWSALTRPHPVCRRLRSCAVSPFSVVCTTGRGYKRYAGARASLTLSPVLRQTFRFFLRYGRSPFTPACSRCPFKLHCSTVLFFRRHLIILIEFPASWLILLHGET